MSDHVLRLSEPVNEPINAYAPGDRARASLEATLKRMSGERPEITAVIGGRRVKGEGARKKVVMPHSHQEVIGEFSYCSPSQMGQAIDAALRAKPAWEAMPWHERASIFLKAADLLAGPYRDILNGATMLGQSKNAYQSEIDAACELIDFLRFNAFYYQEILAQQPISVTGVSNRLDYRPLEGFVAAITPFNFTAIAANLPAAPAMLGNTIVWKPSDTQMLSAHYTMQLFEEAGLPPGVINLVPADGPEFGQAVLGHRELAGVHFTGSTATFQGIYKQITSRLETYRSYPRLVGETGGKDFVFAHPSADPVALSVALLRGAYEYQGQKCSAASRAYIPKSLWGSVRERLIADIATIKVGDTRDFSCFVNAVIDERSFTKISGYLDGLKRDSVVKVLAGGTADRSKGYFVQPTLAETTDPKSKTMVEEIFGPVLTVYPYEDKQLDDTLTLCDSTSAYALTGAIFAQDREALSMMAQRLRHSAGNLYINDKCTGATVGQQPFGGARASGTNDKAGSPLNLYRWLSPRTIKEMRVPPRDYRYPFLG